ncbi:MAG: FmdB family zinc ribbon protein [Roseiflexaceae bacterium]|jgi:putative FmdB family regulatory protein
MPTYVYACDTCQVQFEKFQSFNDEPLRSCPTCQNSVRRVIQPAGVVFKGTGWHINDYRAHKGTEASSDAPAAAPVTPAAADAPAAAPATPAPAAAPAAPAPSTASSATDA